MLLLPTFPKTQSPTPAPSVRPRISWSTNFPLGLCEGDCDKDDDCQDGLVCFQRDEFEDVPGCIGGRENDSRTDYCVPKSSSPSLAQRTRTIVSTDPPTEEPSETDRHFNLPDDLNVRHS